MSGTAAVVNGPAGRLNVVEHGAGGVPVLFIHSLAGNARQWQAQVDHAARSRRAIAMDLRGHGQSECREPAGLGPAHYADDIRAVLDALKVPRATLVAHSLGSAAAIAFASRAPDRVAGLLLVDPIDDPSKRPESPGFEDFLRRLAGDEYREAIDTYWTQILQHASPQVRDSVMAAMRATDKRVVIGSMRGLQGFDASAALGQYGGPVMSITTPLNDGPSSLHKLMPALRHERVTGVSHWLQMDRPEEFNRLLDTFLTTAR